MANPVSELSDAELLAELQQTQPSVSELSDEELLAELEATGGHPAVQYGQGMASGAVQAMTEPVAAVGRIAARGARALGVPVSEDPVRAVMHRAGLGLPQTTAAGRAGERAGQWAGMAALPVGGAAALAARGAAVPAAKIAAAEGVSAVGGAVGEEVGREVAGDVGGAVGGLVGSIASPAAATTVRGAVRGTTPHALRKTMAQAADVGVELTPSQALPTPARRNVAASVETTFGTIPGGRQVADIRGMEQQAQMGRALERAAGGEETLEGAGMLVQSGLREFIERWRPRKDAMYAAVDDLIDPGLEVPLANTRRTMRQITETRENIRPLLAALQNERIARIAAEISDVNRLSYDEMRMLRSAVGRQLENPSLVDNLPRSEMKRLYAALTQDMKGAVQGPARRKLENADKFYKASINRIETFLDPAVRNAEPGRVMRNLIQGGKVGSKRIRAIRDGMRPEDWRRVQSAVLRDIGRQTGSGLGEYSHERFLTNFNNLRRNSPEAVDALFGKYGRFRRDVEKLADVAERIREGSRVLFNPSGTGARQTAAAGGGGAIMAGLMGRPDILASMLGTAAVAGLIEYAFTRPAVTRWLARTTTIPGAQLPGHLSRLETILERERARDARR